MSNKITFSAFGRDSYYHREWFKKNGFKFDRSSRKWVVENLDNDQSAVYRKVYDSMYTALESSSIPQAVLIFAKYQYQSAFAVDPEINTLACLTELMCDCKFK